MCTAISYQMRSARSNQLMVCYCSTDGITAPRNAEGPMYEELGRFHEVLSELSDELNAEEVMESIIQDVIDYMVDEEERDDDITLVAVKVT